MDKQKISILILVIVLVFVLNYFLLDEIFSKNQRQVDEAFISGRDQGIKETITTLFEGTEDCNIIPIFIENSSKKIVDFACVDLEKNLDP